MKRLTANLVDEAICTTHEIQRNLIAPGLTVDKNGAAKASLLR